MTPSKINRRRLLQTAAFGAGAVAVAARSSAASAKEEEFTPKGNINHSLVNWCYQQYWNPEKICQVAKGLGVKSIEIIPPEHWPTLKKNGLICALASSHLFVQGMNNPKYQPMCLEMLRKSIDNCAEAGFPTVITFTGFAEETGEWANGGIPDFAKLSPRPRKIDPEEGIKNCVQGFKQIVGYAEKKKINLSLEMLNSRVAVEMKGHPGYQGDYIDYCMEIIKQVGSPRFGLLFDIYHVQIMDGDIIVRLKQCKDVINHIHTAGNPGRCEIDENQEINYPPIMKALVEIGYKGYVGHEFIPTRDPLAGVTQAVKTCDV